LSGNDRNGSVSGSNAGVAVNVGDTLNFAVNASGHPFYIRVSNGGANVSTPAATNQGTQSGTVSWTPNTAGTYYYQCGNHSGMIGTITVSDSTTSINLSDGNVIYFTQNVDTTVSFANTGTSNIVSFIRPGANYTLTWPSAINWDGGSAPTLNTTSGENEVFTLLTRDEGVTWYGWESMNQEFAVKKQLWAWGGNNDGRLGQNSLTQYSSPVQVGSDESWSGVSDTGDDGVTAAVKNGQLFTWGYNNKGSAGHDNIQQDHRLSSPTQIPGTNWSNWVVTNKNSTMASKTDGTLWSWGLNEYGQLGHNQSGANAKYSSPVQIPGTTWDTGSGKYAQGYTNGYAIKTDGTLWGWGMNERGSLGLNNKTYYSSPVQIPGTTWLYVSAGFTNVLATKTDGTMWGWGLNGDGELGLNNLTQYSSPKQIPGTTWHRPNSHGTANLATKTDGTLWSMGYNFPGFFGNDRVARSSPTQIPGTTWDKDKVRMGGGSIGALKTDGTMWIWGRNFRGELGQNQAGPSNISSPVQVPGTWTDIGGMGGYATLALR
jgi:alpha-tubulin suppressor-like RCC1 family protein